MRAAFANMVWNTGSSSPGDELITRSTSEVAVCCSKIFAEIGGALAQFVEQPRILDGDDGLGGKVLHQRNLLVGERPHHLAIDDNGADELIIFEHGYDEFGPRAGGIGKCYDEAIAVEVALVKPKIGNMDDLFAFNDAVERGAGVRLMSTIGSRR